MLEFDLLNLKQYDGSIFVFQNNKMEYIFEIIETLSRFVNIESVSYEDAERQMREDYAKERIVLSADDYVTTEFIYQKESEESPHLQDCLTKCHRLSTAYKSPNRDFTLLHGDTFELLPKFDFKFDAIFADPPYFLSNGGFSVQSGKVVSVNKGDWDKGLSQEEMHAFNRKWLSLCREKLKDNGTIWVSGTYHNIFSVANCLTELGYKILNVITWAKTNPPPNISCRYFTYSTEFVIWARKSEKNAHYFNYELMRQLNDNKQMTDVWRLPAIARWEKSCGKHPTQKPLALLARILLASTEPGAWVFDPFCGSSTTGIAANLLGRRYLGIDKEMDFIELSRKRREELNSPDTFALYRSKIKDIEQLDRAGSLILGEDETFFGDLPF